MIVPQLARCRQCKAYLHGTLLEGLLVENLIPQSMQKAPGTATMAIFICLFYALMLALGGETSVKSFSSFSLLQLGATEGTSIILGDYWRFVTSMFGHHDPLHLILNLASLVRVGQLVEEILDRKKMLLIYLATGVVSMIISHFWYTQVRGDPTYVSAGASGAVCGMIGAAWFAARKAGHHEIVSSMKRWSVLMVVWGFAVPGINNAAHFGGFAVGALLAHLTPLGHAKTVGVQRVLSVIALAAIALVLGSCALMIKNLRGYPVALADDWRRGKPWDYSNQKMYVDACVAEVDQGRTGDEALRKCELARRSERRHPQPYQALAKIYAARGEHERAATIAELGDRVAWTLGDFQ